MGRCQVTSGMFATLRHGLWHLRNPGQDCSGVQVTTRSVTALHRQMLYDAFSNPERVAQVLQLPPISAELVEMEQRDHRVRTQTIEPLLPILAMQADFMTTVAMRMQQDQSPYELSEAETEHAVRMISTLLHSTLIASVASMADMGVVQVSGGVVE